MKMPELAARAAAALVAMTEIKAHTEAFDRGEANLFDALDAIGAAVEACRPAGQDCRDAA